MVTCDENGEAWDQGCYLTGMHKYNLIAKVFTCQ